MVAIVSGSGLGLSNSSAQTLGQRGTFGSAANGRNGEQLAINIATGNLVVQDQDSFQASQGSDIATVRTYNSQGLANDDNGDNWISTSFAPRLILSGAVNTANSTLSRTERDGASSLYVYNTSSKKYISTDGDGAHDQIVATLSNGVVTGYAWLDGSTRATAKYDANGVLQTSTDATGNVLSYAYVDNNPALLKSVSDTHGGVTQYEYVGNLLSKILVVAPGEPGRDQTSLRHAVRYEYDSNQRLEKVTVDLSPEDNAIDDGKLYVTRYTYDGTSTRLASITQSDGSILRLGYEMVRGAWRVVSATDGENGTMRFDYSDSTKTVVTNATGHVSSYGYDSAGQLTSVNVAAPGSTSLQQQVAYEYDSKGNLKSIQDAYQRKTLLEYDANGNQTRVIDANGNETVRTYGSKNQLLSETVYVLDETGGLTPAPDDGTQFVIGLDIDPNIGPDSGLIAATTYYVYNNANQLRFRISPEGRVLENRYATNGNLTASIQYNGNLFDVSGLGSFLIPNESMLTGWLQSTSASAAVDKTQTTRTDYQYDVRGMLKQSVSYARIDANGNGVVDGSESVTTFVYDAGGQLRQTIRPNSVGPATQTSYAWDGLGRLISTLDGAGLATTIYDDAGQRIVSTAKNGLVTTSAYDKAGRLISVASPEPGSFDTSTTQFTYDAAGRLRMTQNSGGQRNFMMYDAAGRKVAEIDADGSLTEYRYDLNNRLLRTLRYETPVDIETLVDATGQVPLEIDLPALTASLSVGSNQWNRYDALGRLAKTVDALGYVTEYHYDALSRLTGSTQYANNIQPGNADLVADTTPLTSAQDRHSRVLYDLDGKVVGQLDAEGYLTEMQYDAGGQLLKSVRYATPANAAALANGTLAQLRPATSAADIVQRQFYDARGLLVASIDAENWFTEHIYDKHGNRTITVRYATAVSNPAASTLAQLRPKTNGQDYFYTYTYNSLDQLVSQTAEDGTVTSFEYDSVGNLLSSTRAADTLDARTSVMRRDAHGRVIAELTPEGAALLAPGQTAQQINQIWETYGVKHEYDASGLLTRTTDQHGHATLFLYDADGRLSASVNAAGEVTYRAYNTLNQLEQITTFATRLTPEQLQTLQPGYFTQSAQDMLNGLYQEQDGITVFGYDQRGQLIRQETGDAVHENSYDAFGAVKSSTDLIDDNGRRAVRNFRYDRRGLLLESDEAPDASTRIVHSRQYDAFGREVSSSDGKGNQNSIGYDRLGRVISIKNPLTPAVRTTWDAFGRQLTQTDGSGNTTSTRYDTAARSFTISSSEGVTQTIVNNRHGQKIQVVDADGKQTVFEYDHNGSLTRVSDQFGTRVENQYDAAGRLSSSVDGNGIRSVLEYDAVNRVLSRTLDPAGLNLTTAYEYDAKGQVFKTTSPAGVVTSSSFDSQGRVKQVVVDDGNEDHLNLSTRFEYDRRGLTVKMTDAAGLVTQYQYDDSGRRIAETLDPDALAITTRYIYDANNNVATRIDANGHKTHFVYDANNRLADQIDALGSVLHYEYDANNRVSRSTHFANLLTAEDLASLNLEQGGADAAVMARVRPDPLRDNVTSNVYDKDGQLRFSLDATGAVAERRYDHNGRLVQEIGYAGRIPAGTALNLAAFSAAVATIRDDARDQVSSIEYDMRGRVSARSSGGLAGARTVLEYDGNDNLIHSASYANAGGALLAQQRQVFDSHNRVVASATAQNLDANGVLQWSVVSQSHDAAGNIVLQTAHAAFLGSGTLAANPSQAQVAQWLATLAPDAVHDSTTRFVYDKLNRLQYSLDALGAVTGFKYDAAGNVLQSTRYAKAVSLPAGTVSADDVAGALQYAFDNRTTRYEYDALHRLRTTRQPDGLNIVNEYDAVGNLTAVRRGEVSDLSHYRLERHVFDAANHLRFSIDGEGYVSESVYDGLGRQIRRVQYAFNTIPYEVAALSEAEVLGRINPTHPENRSTQFSYDASGNLLTTTDALNHTESYRYDGLGRKLAFVNKLGKEWQYDYDSAGNLITERSPQIEVSDYTGSSAMQTPVTRNRYDARGKLIARTETNAEGSTARTTSYEYDLLGRQIKTSLPLVPVYDAASDPLNTNDAARREIIPAQAAGSSVVYDALGNAIRNIDAAGNITRKVYDVAGRLRYEIDAMGYVTSYRQNAFGDVTQLTRHAEAISIDADSTPDVAAIAALLAQQSGRANRVLTSEYDALGRVIRVAESAGFVLDTFGQVYQPSEYYRWHGMVARVTATSYNAFGEVEQQMVYGDATVGSQTSFVYNRRGEKVRKYDLVNTWQVLEQSLDLLDTSADSGWYKTEFSYDAAGNMTRQVEFASTLGSEGTGFGPQDRITDYGYDLNNERISETRRNVEVDRVDASGAARARADVVTRYDYDATGNLTATTDALGGVTRSYYDAIGRVVAVAASAGFADASQRNPLSTITEFKRDLFGYVVQQINRAQQAVVDASHLPVLATNPDDRITRVKFDLAGHAIETIDANEHVSFASWDIFGRMVKQWQPVTDVDGKQQTLFTQYRYDALGRLTHSITPANNPSLYSPRENTRQQTYNAFGEVIARSMNNVQYEYAEFDNAGNLWRTNAGDGVDKVYIYTGTGKLSMQIRSTVTDASSVYSVMHYQSAKELFAYAYPLYGEYDPHFIINETRYDLMGRIIEQIGTQQVSETGTSAAVIDRGAVMGAVISISEWEEDGGQVHRPHWYENNVVELNFAMSSRLESSEYRVTVDYQKRPNGWINDPDTPPAQPSTPATYTTILNASDLPGSVGKVSIKIPGAAIDESQPQRYRIEMKDINGQWKPLVDSTNIRPAPLLNIGAPPQALAAVTLKYTQNGVEQSLTGWASMGETVLFDTAGIPPGNYTYKVMYRDAILGAEVAYAKGRFEIKDTPSGKTASIQTDRDRATGWSRPISNQRLDRWGNVVSVTSPHESTWSSTYSDPRIASATTHFTYNANNQVMDQVQDMADLNGNLITLRGSSNYYDALGRQTAARDAMNNLETKVYNNSGQLGDEYHADGGQTHHEYNVFGDQTTLRYKVDAATWMDQFYDWDKLGHVMSVSTAEVDVYKTGFYGEPELVAVRDGTGPRKLSDTYHYDELGRRILTTNAADESIKTRYDADGNVIDLENALHQHTVSHFDAFHHKIDETNANGDTMSWVVDAWGRISSHKDLSGTEITYSYDGLNQLISQKSGTRSGMGDKKQELVYTWKGLQLTRIDDITTGNITTYAYDLAGRRTRERTTVKDLVPVAAVPEANSREAFLAKARKQVVQFYVALLNRTPDPQGWMHWLTQLQNANHSGGNSETNRLARIQVAKEIVESDEAQARYPRAASDADFIRALYQTAVNRQPTQDELDSTLAWLAEPHSRAEAIVRFIDGITAPEDHAAFDPRVDAALPPSTPGQTRNAVVQNNVIEYDALGRTTHVADGRFDVRFEYDANDNRTRVETRQADSYVDAHNTFDQMNRAAIINGDEVVVNGQKSVVAGVKGHFIQYDYAGRRTRDSYTYKHAGVDAATTEEFSYDAAGRLTLVRRGTIDTDVRFYDAAGRVVQSGQLIYGPDSIPDEVQLADYGVLAENRTYGYDAAGHVMRTKFRQLDGKSKDDVYYTDEGNGNVPGYDAAGNLRHYSVVPENSLAHNTRYSIDYVAFDSYKEKSVQGKVDDTTKTSLSEYDVNGHLIKLSGAGDGTTTSLFANDANGHILRKTYADAVGKAWSYDFNMIVNGEMLGGMNSRSNSIEGFANPYESAGSSANTSAPTIYHVQNASETLQSVARAVWGDSRLWFMIADANGLNDSSGLTANQILKIPPRSNTVYDDANTFKPYDPSASIGNTTPELPPAIPGEPCGGAGKIIVAIVAIIVTVVVSYIAGPQAGGESGGAFMGAFAAEEAAVLGAAAGNLAGQAVGNIIGVQQGFDFKGFTLSVLAAGASAGLPVASKFAAGALGVAYRAAVANALSQGIAIGMGMQKGFEWRGVAASAAGAALGEYVGGKLDVNGAPPSTFDMADFGKRLLKSFAAGGTTAIAKGGKISVVQVAADAFGNTLGQAVAEKLNDSKISPTEAQLRHDEDMRDAAMDGAFKNGGGTQEKQNGFLVDYVPSDLTRNRLPRYARFFESPFGSDGNVIQSYAFEKKPEIPVIKVGGTPIDYSETSFFYKSALGFQQVGFSREYNSDGSTLDYYSNGISYTGSDDSFQFTPTDTTNTEISPKTLFNDVHARLLYLKSKYDMSSWEDRFYNFFTGKADDPKNVLTSNELKERTSLQALTRNNVFRLKDTDEWHPVYKDLRRYDTINDMIGMLPTPVGGPPRGVNNPTLPIRPVRPIRPNYGSIQLPFQNAPVNPYPFDYKYAVKQLEIIPARQRPAVSAILTVTQSQNWANSDNLAVSNIRIGTFIDFNQSSRVNANPNSPTLISDLIDTMAAKRGKVLPNGNMGTAHAEIGAIQQSFESGLSKGGHGVMNVKGLEICPHCRSVLIPAISAAGYKTFTIYENSTGNVFYWEQGLKKFQVKQ